MSKQSVYISISLVALVLGLLLAVQFRVTNDYPGGLPRERTEELAGELSQIREENKNFAKEIKDLKKKVEQMKAGRQAATAAISDELDKMRVAAGLVTVTGPGVEIIMDNPKEAGRELPAELSVIRDGDFLKVINELRAAGAEALSLNGNRIITSSEIRFAGSFINVNTKRIVPPYQILAIGDPEALAEALLIPGGLYDYLGKDLGIEIKIKKHPELTIPAYTGEIYFKYAKQTKEGE